MAYQRFAITVRWDRFKKRYVATFKQYTSLIAFGPTRQEAEDNLRARLEEYLKERECKP